MLKRIMLLCGVFSPLLYALADTLAGLRWAGYSFRDQTISELGAIGAPTRFFFSSLIIPAYLLLIVFGVGIWQWAGGNRRLRVAAGLLVAFGVIAVTVGPFVSMQLREAGQGLAGLLHLVEGGLEMVILFVAMGFAAASLGRGFRRYTIITLVLVLAFGVWSGMSAPDVAAGLPTPWLGVKERIFWYTYQLWYAVLALRLLWQWNKRGQPA